jgi:hypothetical protein
LEEEKGMEYSPALSANSDMTEEELEKYLETYIPLSNLPTPPPAKEQHAIPTAPRSPVLPPTTTPESYSPEIQGTFVRSNCHRSSTCHITPLRSKMSALA